jgi:hypothetical protein
VHLKPGKSDDLLIAEPVVLPLLGPRTVAIGGRSDESDVVVTTAILRQLASVMARRLRVDYFDPLDYSPFNQLGLCAHQDGVRLTNAEMLHEHLSRLRQRVVSNAGADTGRSLSQLVVLHDFPVDIDQSCFDEVKWLAEHGPKAGVHLLLQLNDDYEGPLAQSAAALVDLCFLVEVANNRFHIDGLESLDLVPDPPLAPSAFESVWEWLGSGLGVVAEPPVDPDWNPPNRDLQAPLPAEGYWNELFRLNTLIATSDSYLGASDQGSSLPSKAETGLLAVSSRSIDSKSSTRHSWAELQVNLVGAEAGIVQAQQLSLIPRVATVAILLVVVFRTFDPGMVLAGSFAGLVAGLLLLGSRDE